jgi:bidirectional [NiFe] hydrogenase diaphorase subunit
MVSTLIKKSQIEEVSKTDPRVKRVLKAIDTYQRKPDCLIQVLHHVQDLYGYLPLGILKIVATEMKVAPSRVFGVATFYHYFSLKPKGEHTCLVCTGTACYVKGAQKIIDQLEKEFKIKPGEITPDNKLGVQTARCIGACGLAPAIVVDNEILQKVNADTVGKLVRDRMEVKS